MSEGINRRDFLKVLTVTSGGVFAACSSPQSQKLIPYVVPPEDVIPGVSVWHKSVCRECPAGCGTLVRTREGRVVKVEGNPDHPVNRGALCARGQAATQGLYNPDRITQPLRRNEDGKLEPITWNQAEELLASVVSYLRYTKRAHRIALVSERVTGSLERLFREWLATVGSQHFLQYEPFAYEALRAANKICFGTSEVSHIDMTSARMVLSFGADFLETYLSSVEYTRQFAQSRKRMDWSGARFVAVGPRLSLTAANADEWIAVRPGSEVFVALCLVGQVLSLRRSHLTQEQQRIQQLVEPYGVKVVEQLAGVPGERLRNLAYEFGRNWPGLALGPNVSTSGPLATTLQVAADLLNYVSGNVGIRIAIHRMSHDGVEGITWKGTVFPGRGANWDSVATHQQMLGFVEQMRTEQMDAVFFHHVNPAFNLPEAAGFSRALARVPFKVSFTPFMDETAAQCDLILPENTPLERWEDYTPRAGVYGLVQPAMRAGFHFQSKQAADVLLSISPKVDAELGKKFPFPDFREYIREQWKSLHRESAPRKPFEEFWREAVENGGLWREVPARGVRLNEEVFRFKFPDPHETTRAATGARSFSPDKSTGQDKAASAPEVDGRGMHLVVYPSLQLFDGRGANRPWLQETPDAMTKIVWGSWAEIHPDRAKSLGISEGDLLKVTSASGSIQIPAHLFEGIRPDAIAIPLGQGHTNFGRWAEGHGPNPMKLLPAETEVASGGLLWAGTRVTIEKLAINRPPAQTQIETSQHDRGIAQAVPLGVLLGLVRDLPPETPEHEPALSMYPPHSHPEHRWGMAIDLNACAGCNACIVACYAENNVPWVGKEQVARGRHMAWIRVDRYFEPRTGGPETRFVPMLCQHCDNAPCESVCPVYATYHNFEGLNVQVYNRCVGTRYCSNNCPYKVRRFNWFDHEWPWPMQLGLNPDLSARTKGVMEKCTFCIQRIREGKDRAKDEKRPVRDGDITPACAQTCPTNAIVFGDLNEPKSRVSQIAKDSRHYQVLGELNTRPAITYLKKVTRGEEG